MYCSGAGQICERCGMCCWALGSMSGLPSAQGVLVEPHGVPFHAAYGLFAGRCTTVIEPVYRPAGRISIKKVHGHLKASEGSVPTKG